MPLKTVTPRIPAKGVLAIAAALAVLFSVLTAPAVRAHAAEPEATGTVAPIEALDLVGTCENGGWVPVWDGPQVNAHTDGNCEIARHNSAATAVDYVRNSCYGDGWPELDGFCTIQRWGGQYYVYEFWGCDLWDLRGFRGKWDTYNHGELSVWFYGQPDSNGVQRVIGKYGPHRSDPVDWGPIWTFRTCA